MCLLHLHVRIQEFCTIKGRRFEGKWFKVRNRAKTWPYLMRYYVSSASACADPGIFTKSEGGGGRVYRPT